MSGGVLGNGSEGGPSGGVLGDRTSGGVSGVPRTGDHIGEEIPQ